MTGLLWGVEREFHPDAPAYGWHLVTDYRGCSPVALENSCTLERWVRELVVLLGMKPHGQPIIEHFGHDSPITSGYSVVQLITMSSITAHLSPYLGTAHVDVFSCQRFEPVIAIEHTAAAFKANLDETRSVFLGRG